jgi:hypothetical protein
MECPGLKSLSSTIYARKRIHDEWKKDKRRKTTDTN